MDLIERLKLKDEEALREVMQAYGHSLLRTGFLLLKDEQMAEEAVQDTFIKAFQKIDQLTEPHKLKSWLTSILVNQCRERMRTWSWKNVLLLFKEDESFWEQESESSVEALVIQMEEAHSLFAFIQSLDYKYREVITLYYYNEWSVEELASYLQVNKNTIKSRLMRGRQQLHKMLVEEELRHVESVQTKQNQN